MHELALAQSIARVVEARANACRATRVKGVRLVVGEASEVMADSLIFSFEMLADLSPPLTSARLPIEPQPPRAYSRRCAR